MIDPLAPAPAPTGWAACHGQGGGLPRASQPGMRAPVEPPAPRPLTFTERKAQAAERLAAAVGRFLGTPSSENRRAMESALGGYKEQP